MSIKKSQSVIGDETKNTFIILVASSMEKLLSLINEFHSKEKGFLVSGNTLIDNSPTGTVYYQRMEKRLGLPSHYEGESLKDLFENGRTGSNGFTLAHFVENNLLDKVIISFNPSTNKFEAYTSQ